LANIVNNKCITMCHKDYPIHLMYVCTLPCKVRRVKIVTKHIVISTLLLARLMD